LYKNPRKRIKGCIKNPDRKDSGLYKVPKLKIKEKVAQESKQRDEGYREKLKKRMKRCTQKFQIRRRLEQCPKRGIAGCKEPE
jgi:hypothetical protein